MAKKSKEMANLKKVATPDGFEEVSPDVEAFVDPQKETVYCTLHGVNLSDSKLEKHKVTALLIGTLLKGCPGVDSEGNEVEVPEGASVGIWYKAGLRAVVQCAGVPVCIQYRGTKDVGKPKPMHVYSVAKRKGATATGKLAVQDFRRNSLHVETPFTDGASKGSDDGEDFVPF